MRPFTGIAIAIFAIIAIAHVIRLFTGWVVTFSGHVLPVWVSMPGAVVAGGLAFLVWRESKR